MAPKNGSKAAPRGSRDSPVLSMLVDSPDRGTSSRSTIAKPKSFAPFGFQGYSLGNASVKASKGLRALTQPSSPFITQGKAKEETSRADLLWCDSYAPRQRSELGIHKKKIEQVEGWLKEALNGKSAIKQYRRILVLSGPSGSGKSTLLKILSRSDELNFEITEWNSDDVQAGVDSEYYWDRGRSSEQTYEFGRDTERASLPSKLGLFLSNASRYSTLVMLSENDDTTVQVNQATSSSSKSSRRIIMLEDLPNLSHLPTRTSFHATLDAFLQQRGDDITPLVIVVSESVPKLDEWGAESSSKDFKERNESTMTVRNLIPNSIRSSVGFMNIEFNVVAPTILTKALKRVLELARSSHADVIPAPSSVTAREIITIIIESAEGDLRNAVNTLQVVCLNNMSGLAGKRGTKRKSNGKEGTVSKRAIAAVNGKETSLVLFHALGKILYNKRVGDPNDDEGTGDEDDDADETATEMKEDIPIHWHSLVRRKSRVDCEMLWRSMPVDASTLQAFLHQNYTPFCDDIEQCAALCDNISIADSIRPAHEEWSHATLTDYYNFLITVHGSLLSLPSPVSRNQTRKMKGVALFQKIKELRENTEKLNDVRVAFREEAQEYEEEMASSTLSAASAISLLCEVLPLLSKSYPDILSARAKEIVHLPWNHNRGEEARIESEEEAVTASYQEDVLQERFVQVDVPFKAKEEAKSVTKLIDEDDDEIEYDST